MSQNFVVRLRFEQSASVRPELQRFVGLAKLPTDAPGHPSGQWSVVIELWAPPNNRTATGTMRFASPQAPRHIPSTFSIYAGPALIADVDVLAVPRDTGLSYDNDFLADPKTSPRAA